jgi:hypothetical protein
MNWNLFRRFDAQPDLLASDAHHRHDHLIVDDNTLTAISG